MQHDQEVRRICATAYLEHVRSLKTRIDSLQERIEPLREAIGNTMDYRERVSASPNPKAFEDAVIRLQDLIADYCTEIAEFAEEQHVAYGVTRRLSRPEYRMAIEMHYIDGKPWNAVCKVMGSTKYGRRKLRRTAVQGVYYLSADSERRAHIPDSGA